MSTPTAPVNPATEAAIERNLDLVHRFLLGVLDDPSRFEGVPVGASVVLLPDDAEDTFEANLAMAIELARSGRDVYLRHVRLAELPEPAPPLGPSVGDRRVTYDEAGNPITHLVYGADGAWHHTDAPSAPDEGDLAPERVAG